MRGIPMAIYVVKRDGSGLKEIVAANDAPTSDPVWSPHGDELVYEHRDREKTTLQNRPYGGIFRTTHTPRVITIDADWFDPAFALPVSPQPHLLTTVWGKLKIRN